MPTVTPLTPDLAARVTDIDLTRPLGDGEFDALRTALSEHLVLVFADQPIDDDQQVAFSKRFGPLEWTNGVNPASGTPFARQSNIDIRTGEVIPGDDRRMFYQKANMLWHSDSTFKAVPSLCSVLSAREIPAEGGATEFASTRTAYEELSLERQAELDMLTVEHDFVFSRGQVGFRFTDKEAALFPPVRHKLVRTDPITGRKSLLIGAHAKGIVGWSHDDGRTLLEDLLARATRPERCYRHDWRTGDVVMWHNQAALHRATPYDASRFRRFMQRTTVSAGAAAA